MDAEVRDFVRQRAGNRCEYCLLPEESDEWPFHVEHVIAKQHGGSGRIGKPLLVLQPVQSLQGPEYR